MSSSRDVLEQAFEVDFHRPPCTLCVMCLDRGEDGLVFDDHLCDPSALGQGQPAIAVDVNLHLLDILPDSGVAGDIGDCSMKHFVGLMEGFTVSRGAGLALA